MKRTFKTMGILCCAVLVLTVLLPACSKEGDATPSIPTSAPTSTSTPETVLPHTHTPNPDTGICDGCGEQLDYVYDEAAETYTVYTADGLYTWAERRENLVLGNDITLPSEMNADLDGDGINESNWQPFSASVTIDGNGHSITGMTVINAYFAGFLSNLEEGGSIKNLSLKDVRVEGSGGAGGIVCYNNGTIVNCSVSGDVACSSSNVGGIAGNNFGGSIIACHNAATVHSTLGVVGGIVGQYNEGSVIACSNTGAVMADNQLSGIAGGFFAGKITACYSTGTVTMTENGNGNLGAIAGYCQGDLSANYWYMAVEGTSVYGNGYEDSNDNADYVDGKTLTWADAMAAMNAALESADCQWRYAVNTGDDAAERPLVLENVE